MAQDMETVALAVERAFGPRRTAGLFHSLSTIVSLLHFARFGHRWDRLILFDPPMTPPAGPRLHDPARNFEIALARWALHRKSTFTDPDELARYFKSTRRASAWVAGAAELMARSITRPAAGGGYELVCPGAYKSTIYEQNWQAPVWSYLPRAAERLFIISSDPTAKDADTAGTSVRRRRRIRHQGHADRALRASAGDRAAREGRAHRACGPARTDFEIAAGA